LTAAPARRSAALVDAVGSTRRRRQAFANLDGTAVRVAVALIGGLIAAELVTFLLGSTAGMLAHIALLVTAAVLSLGIGGPLVQRLSLSLGVLPLVRIVSLAVPAAIIPVQYWYLQVGLAGLEGMFLVLRRLDLTFRDIGIVKTPVREVAVVTAVGAVLGIPAYLIGGPLDLGGGGGAIGLGLAVLIVAVFVGVFEEILFRGLIQSVGTALFARGGIVLSVTATTVMYAASLNPRYVIFMAAVAVFLGVVARRSGSIAGPIGAHAALAVVQLVVLPIVLT
jgi:membrane protease YdiL (CAAX protease family)